MMKTLLCFSRLGWEVYMIEQPDSTDFFVGAEMKQKGLDLFCFIFCLYGSGRKSPGG